MRHSCGFILFRQGPENQVEYLLQCRRDTIPYLVYLQGRYIPEELESLWSRMTRDEHRRIRTCSYRDLFHSARVHPECWEQGQRMYQKCYRLIQPLVDSDGWETPEWGFPKGRKNHKKESDRACAIRELLEETGLRKEQIQVLDLPPIRERFQGTDQKWYTCDYYFATALADPTIYSRPQDDPEVSALGWFTLMDAIAQFRPWETYRCKTLYEAHSLLQKRRLISADNTVSDSEIDE